MLEISENCENAIGFLEASERVEATGRTVSRIDLLYRCQNCSRCLLAAETKTNFFGQKLDDERLDACLKLQPLLEHCRGYLVYAVTDLWCHGLRKVVALLSGEALAGAGSQAGSDMHASHGSPKPTSGTRRALGVADALQEHMALSREHDALMREVAELRDAGKIGEARRLMKKTEAVYGQLKALESNDAERAGQASSMASGPASCCAGGWFPSTRKAPRIPSTPTSTPRSKTSRRVHIGADCAGAASAASCVQLERRALESDVRVACPLPDTFS